MSGNNDNKTNYNDLTKKEQENISAQKAGQTGARAAANVVTGGKYEKLRKIPGLGKIAKKQEENVGKKVGNLDKATGGKVGKIAKPLNDSGAIDKVNKGMNVVGGNVATSNPNNIPEPTPNNNNPNGINKKTNFAKNGFNDENKVPNGNSEGANKSRLREIFNNRKGVKDFFRPNNDTQKKSLFNNKKQSNSKDNSGELVADFAAEGVKKLIKTIMIPFIIGVLVFLFMAMFILLSAADKNDASAVDQKNKSNKSEKYGDDYTFGDDKQKEFYRRVIKVELEYNMKGKYIDPIYITSTYHVIKRYKNSLKYDDMNDKVIEELANGMLSSSNIYSKEAYTVFLKTKFFPKYFNDYSEDKINKIIDEIFEYIDEYMKDVYGDQNEKKCATTTGGTCTYDVKDYKGNSLNLTDLKVRLMSSSHCHGQDNVAISDELISFEDYILGVARVENYSQYSESTKAQLIAARNFALNRPAAMGPSLGNKYVKEGNSNILQMRSSVADQMFCSPDKGCSADGPYFQNPYNYSDCYVSYIGTGHAGAKIEPLSQTASIRNYWKETMGMVAVDANNRLVYMTFTSTDQNAWNTMAAAGKDYIEILLTHYPKVKEIKKANCTTKTDNTENAFIKVAHEIWQQVTDAGTYSYGSFGIVPPNPSKIDCSSYVDWVLYKYGYEDFGGAQRRTEWFVNTDLHAKYGWTEISVAAGEDVTNKLQPGDILVRDPGNNDGHMAIVSEIRSDGTVWGYDCGDAPHWQLNKGGKPYNFSSFVKNDRRSGKIIRVTNDSTGDSCQTAASGEWSEWRQNGNAPWRNIPLGTRGDTIGTVGCYVTSLAIQIARSGAQTTISNFNPGTFVNEIKKTPNAFSDGGGLNWVGENSITNFVPGFKIVSSHIPVGNTKSEQIATIQKYIDQGYYVILNLDGGKHWVAVTGTTNDNIQMVDPGRNGKNVYDIYSPSSLVKINVYSIK